MDRYSGPKTALNIAWLGVLLLVIIMDLVSGPKTALNIALLGGL
jgi:hypothetical protein